MIVDFNARGVLDVLHAFDRIEQRMERMERSAGQTASRGARDREQIAKREIDERERAYARLQRDLEREEQKRVSGAERAAQKIAREEVREAERAAREIERLEEYKLRVRIRSSEMAGRAAATEAAAEIRAAEQAAAARARLGTRVMSSIGGRLGGLANFASGAIGIGGSFAIADAARREGAAELAAAQLVNSATIGGVRPEGATIRNILGEAGRVSGETGVDRTDLIGALQNYVAKSSDFAGGLANMGFFAKLSTATGTRLEDITGAAGILRAQNKGLSVQDMQQMLLDLTEQGKQGAVEIQDLAHLAGGLGATRGMYRGSTMENQRKLLALAQITRTESESPEEAATGVKDLGIEALKKSVGKNAPVWLRNVTKGGFIESPEALIEAALTGTGGNLGQLEGVFGARGVKAFMRLAPIFNAAGGGQAGIAAVRAEMSPILNARGSQQRLDQQFGEVMSTPAERMKVAIEKIENTLMDKLEPVLEHLAEKLPEWAPAISKVLDGLVNMADYLIQNPLQGAIEILGAELLKDAASAGIGTAVRESFREGVSSAFGMGVNIAAATLVIASLLNPVGADETKTAVAGVEGDVDRLKGAATPANLAKVQGDAQRLRARKEQLEKEISEPQGPLGSTVARATRAVIDPVADVLGLNTFKKQLEDVNRALSQTETAAKKAATSLGATASNAPPHPARSEPMPSRGQGGH